MARSLITIFMCVLMVFAAQAQDESAAPAPPPLSLWLPAPLIADETSAAFELLSAHTAAFSQANGIGIAQRIKDVGKVGGILATIRAGSEVAPGALPDIALIRRRDFNPTLTLQYLQSLETLFSSALINDLGAGLEFGQIRADDDVLLYGLPYLFDFLLTMYQPAAIEIDSGYRLRFADALASEAHFFFPAARSNGLNQTFYLQYLAAGGALPRAGVMRIDEAALRETLQFYQDLLERGLISADVLNYQSPLVYLGDFSNASDPDTAAKLGVFNASQYLKLVAQPDLDLRAAAIPTPAGETASIRSGWLWVIVTPDLSRQDLAARFLEWLMEPSFHASFAKALNYLPTQPAILADSLPAAADAQFFAELLAKATMPLPETEGGAAPRLMQEALASVLQGEASAAAATRQALDQLATR